VIHILLACSCGGKNAPAEGETRQGRDEKPGVSASPRRLNHNIYARLQLEFTAPLS
jgi:hypothetical protein